MPPHDSRSTLRQLSVSDVRGIARLATSATIGAARVAEGVQRSVWDTLGAPGGDAPGRTRGITGLVYRGIEAVARRTGDTVDAILGSWQRWSAPSGPPEHDTPGRDDVMSALNGVIGDRLADERNPLAIPMTLRHRGEVLDETGRSDPTAPGRKILLQVHGLCRNESHWRARRPDGTAVDHGETLAAALGYTPVHVRYNSGLHVAANGRELSARLERWVAGRGERIDELSVLAHSMGGLVIRSAMEVARRDGSVWPDRLGHVVFLGTPHHGAPLERAGNWVDAILTGTRYTAPFARIGALRSAGITDLRYGEVDDPSARGSDRFERDPDRRPIVPLPAGVACYAIAGNVARDRGLASDRLVGDGLVPVRSALGIHDDPRRTLGFADGDVRVVFGTNHMELLGSPEVGDQLVRWFTRTA